MSWATTYTPGFLRHVNHLVINGFYARDLDADDFAFIERVRERGIANGDLPCTNTVLVEELDFWHLPYAIARNIERRAGPVERPTEAPERRELRELRSKEWHARRALRAQQKEMEAAELERERQEWERANETRKRRELLSDAEWEAAAPKLRFGKIVKRHFVPQWKLDERGELNEHDKRKRKREERKRKR